MSRNAWPQMEREYSRDLELRDIEKQERAEDRAIRKLGKLLSTSEMLTYIESKFTKEELDKKLSEVRMSNNVRTGVAIAIIYCDLTSN